MSNPNLTNTTNNITSTTNNHVLEEEWEQIDSKLNTLQLEQSIKPIPNIIQRSSPIPPPPTMRIPSETIEPEAIDTALLSAFENQRERMILFQLEDMILQFVKSTERIMEVPSGLNSYRRLLIYRLSERFGLIHSTSDYPNEAGEKIIYLNRTENTYIPTVLLIDLKPKESVENNRMNDESNNSPNSPGNMSVTSSEQSTSQKKVLVMKRHPNHHRNLHTKTNVKNQITVEEKEKAYNEARARIFGESSPGIEGNTLVNDSNEPVNPTNTPSTSVNPSLNQSNRIDIPSQTSNTRPIVPETKNTQPVPQHMPSQTSHNKHKPVNVSTWKEKKGQIRNIESEKYDPDFVRRSNVQPVAVNNNMFVSNPTGYPQSYRQMPPQQMNYQAYPMMQGQPMPGNWVYSPNPYAAYDPYSMQQQGYYGEMQPPQAYYSQQAYPTGSIPPQPPSNGSNPPNRSFQQDFPPLS